MYKSISRRQFLKSGLAGLISMSALAGCKDLDYSTGPSQIVFIDEPDERWEDVRHVIDNSLDGGYSFNFRNLKGEGINFKEVVDINDDKYALDAQGFQFSSALDGIKKSFTITNLKKNDFGFEIGLMGDHANLVFEKIGEKKYFSIGGKDYEIVLSDVTMPKNRRGYYFPQPVFKINGMNVSLADGIGNSGDFAISLKLKPFQEYGVIEVLAGNDYFSSCRHEGNDIKFSGLENIIAFKKNPIILKNQNSYNGRVQEDAYFRIDASFDKKRKTIILNAADKIRIQDSSPESCPGLASRYSRPFEILIEKTPEQADASKNSLEEDFLFNFSPPLEARFELPREGIQLAPEFFNLAFGNNYLLRYAAFDIGKLPNRCQIEKLGKKHLPINGFMTEIIESPQEMSLSLNEERVVNYGGEEYRIKLKSIKAVDSNLPAYDYPIYDFVVEVIKGDLKEESLIKTIGYGYPNRILGINIDPDIALYYKKRDYEIGTEQKFFISAKKFTSPLTLGKGFFSLKKILIPDYEGKIKTITPEGIEEIKYTGNTTYQQVTLAPRFNGNLQVKEAEQYAFRADFDFGFESYRALGDNAYHVDVKEGYSYSDQINNGYIIRLNSIEKVDLSPKS